MLENFKLTREQVFFLVFIGALGNVIYTHTWIDDETDRAAWVASFAGFLLAFPFAAWMLYLGKKYPGHTIFDILETLWGKIPCIVFSVIYISLNIGLAVAMLNMFTQLLKSFFIMFTPVWVIMLFIMSMTTIFVYGGLKAFARTTEMLTVLGILNFFVSFIPAFPKFVHPEYVIPIFDTTLPGFIKGTVFITGAASETLLLLMIILAFIPETGRRYLWVGLSLGASAIVFSAAILMIMAMISPEMAKRIAFGAVNAAKIIQLGDFLRGLEVFIFGTYQFLAIGKITLCLYCAWTAAKKIFNNWKPGIQLLLLAPMIYIPSVWLNSYILAYRLAVLLDGYVILPFTVLLLLLITLGLSLKKIKTGSCAQ